MGFLGAAMKKLILIIWLSALAGGIVSFSLNALYFQYSTGFPLLEVFSVKYKCEKFGHCFMVYYFVPDADAYPVKNELEEPERTVL